MRKFNPNPNGGKLRDRQGAAIVELAIVLPVIVLIVLGTIEATSMIFLRQSLEISAYEGARVALIPGANESNVKAGCNQVLDTRRVKASTITITPSNFQSQPYGTPIKVEVSADCGANSLISSWFYVGRSATSSVTMMKE